MVEQNTLLCSYSIEIVKKADNYLRLYEEVWKKKKVPNFFDSSCGNTEHYERSAVTPPLRKSDKMSLLISMICHMFVYCGND